MDDALLPSPAERLARARSDLRAGLPVALAGPGGVALALAAETATASRLAALAAQGAVLAVTERRAATLKARAYDGDLARLRLPRDAGLDWVRSVADPATDLARPMKGPFAAWRGAEGPDPALARAAIRLAKAARLLPAAVVAPIDAVPPGITAVDAGLVLEDRVEALSEVVSARVPLQVSEAGRVHVFRALLDGAEHVAVEIGQPPRDRPVLARLHSACLTGDLLGSLKCDCGPQLRAALARMGEEGAGVLLYLDQEGRGIGLANKMRAYALQDQGFDTVDANHRLGFEDDERDFRTGAAILQALGFGAVRLLTNNPAKAARMEEAGIRVAERVPLRVGETAQNAAYLATKIARSGHLP